MRELVPIFFNTCHHFSFRGMRHTMLVSSCTTATQLFLRVFVCLVRGTQAHTSEGTTPTPPPSTSRRALLFVLFHPRSSVLGRVEPTCVPADSWSVRCSQKVPIVSVQVIFRKVFFLQEGLRVVFVCVFLGTETSNSRFCISTVLFVSLADSDHVRNLFAFSWSLNMFSSLCPCILVLRESSSDKDAWRLRLCHAAGDVLRSPFLLVSTWDESQVPSLCEETWGLGRTTSAHGRSCEAQEMFFSLVRNLLRLGEHAPCFR